MPWARIVCPFRAMTFQHIRAPMKTAFAPIAPEGSGIRMRENSGESMVGAASSQPAKEMDSSGALGAIGANASIEQHTWRPVAPPIPDRVRWAPEAPDVPPAVVSLAQERLGWNAEAWHDHILYLADRCERFQPARAAVLRQAATSMELQVDSS